MSVLIKGMEMPALCQECDLYIDGACYAKGYRNYRRIMDTAKPDDCPLIEVPTPHGRLGDLDELIEKYGEWYTEEGHRKWIHRNDEKLIGWRFDRHRGGGVKWVFILAV